MRTLIKLREKVKIKDDLPLQETILVRTFSENTKKGEGKVVASLEKFTLPLWINAVLASVVNTCRKWQ